MLRQKNGLTLQQVADELGVHLKTVHRWETGESPPMISLRRAEILTRLFNCSIDELASAYEESRERWLEKNSANQVAS